MKHELNSWSERLVFGAHLTALSNASMICMSIIYIGRYDNFFILPLLSYLMIALIYNFSNVKSVATDVETNPERTGYVQKRNKLLKLFIIFYCLILLACTSLTNVPTAIFVAFLILMELLYPKSLTSKIFGFKDFYIAFFWCMHLFLPIFYYQIQIPRGYTIFCSFIFLRTLVNVIFCDIKDISDDDRKNLKTPPVVLGRISTIRMLHILNLLAGLILVLGVVSNALPFYTISLLATCLYAGIYIHIGKNAKPKVLRYLSYTLVDGEAIPWLVFMLVGFLILK